MQSMLLVVLCEVCGTDELYLYHPFNAKIDSMIDLADNLQKVSQSYCSSSERQGSCWVHESQNPRKWYITVLKVKCFFYVYATDDEISVLWI